MRECVKCLMNDNIPSVHIDQSGLCNYCSVLEEPRSEECSADEEFKALLEKFKDRKYQVIMAYSGGKDSTYTLKLIKEKYSASVLAVTFNNGFFSEDSLKNISTVTDYLGVDSLVVKYPAQKLLKAFRLIEDGSAFSGKALEKASAICNLCIMLIKNMVYYEAIIRGIPIICFGWTPGQVDTARPLIKLDYRMVSRMFENLRNVIVNELGSGYAKYFLDNSFMQANEDRMPYLYYPFVNNGYNEEKILGEIRDIGWVLPQNTDGNSSNCLLNSYANQCHLQRFGYHPYAYEISSMVRRGYMTREDGIKKLDKIKNDNSYPMVKEIFARYGTDQ